MGMPADVILFLAVLGCALLLIGLASAVSAFLTRRAELRRLRIRAAEILPEAAETESAEELALLFEQTLRQQRSRSELERRHDREFIVSRFLSDHSREADVPDPEARARTLLEGEPMDMAGHWFTALYISPGDLNVAWGETGRGNTDYPAALERLRELLEASAAPDSACCVEEQGGRLLLVNFRDSHPETPLRELEARNRELGQRLVRVLEDLRQETGLTCRAALAEPFRDIRQLLRVSKDLRTLLDYEALTGRERTLLTFDDVSFREVDRESAEHWERRFFTALVERDLPAAREALGGILDLEERSGLESIRRVRQKMCMRLRIAADVYGTGPGEGVDISEALSRMERMTSFLEMRKIAYEVMDLLEPQIPEEPEAAPDTELVSYIRENYRDPELSLAQLSEKFGMSQSGVSRAVKSATGEKMVDYLHGLRIAEAQRLLRDTELTVYEICDRVGYHTGWTMTRAFKRYVGLTPGAWREKARQSF